MAYRAGMVEIENRVNIEIEIYWIEIFLKIFEIDIYRIKMISKISKTSIQK
jgi:hypothetical protein